MKHAKSAKVISLIISAMLMSQTALSAFAQEMEQSSSTIWETTNIESDYSNSLNSPTGQENFTIGESEIQNSEDNKIVVFSIENPTFTEKSDSTIYVKLGTPIELIPLPQQTTIKIKDSESNSLNDQDYKEMPVNIVWQSMEYDANVNGIYTFTAILPETYILAEGQELPTAKVSVGNSEIMEIIEEPYEIKNAGIAADAVSYGFSPEAFASRSASGSPSYGSQLSDFAKQLYDYMISINAPIDDSQTEYTIPIENVSLPSIGGSLTEDGRAIFHMAVQSANDAAVFDNPYLFWMRDAEGSVGLRGTNSSTIINVQELVLKFNNIKYTAPQKMVNTLKNNIAGVDVLGNTSEEKAKNIHDFIANQVTYDNSAAANLENSIFGPPDYSYAFEAYGLFDSRKKIVCEGYSKAFKLLCEANGIPCVLVVGTLSGGPHMWNYVQMDDGNWYGVDVTNDDDRLPNGGMQIGQVSHDLFLVGANTPINFDRNKTPFSKFDIPTGQFSSGGQNFIYPSLSSEKYEAPVASDSKVVLGFDKSSYYHGETIVMTATVSEIPATRSVEEVEFLFDGVSQGSVALKADRTASLSYKIKSNDTLGSHTITAVYNGRNSINGSQAEGQITINKSSLTVSPEKIEKSFLYSEVGNKTIDLLGFRVNPTNLTLNYQVGDFKDEQGILNGTPIIDANSLSINLKGQQDYAEKSIDIPVIISADNYEPVTVTISVKLVNKTPVVLSGISVQSGKIYDKSPIQVVGTPVYTLVDGGKVVPTSKLVYKFMPANGTDYTDVAPTDAGDYVMIPSLEDTQYVISNSTPIQFSIAQKPVTIIGLIAPDHLYDSKTVVKLNHDNAQIQGIVAGDVVTAVYPETGVAASANVGAGIAVTFEPITLAGDSAKNYTINPQPVVTVKIVVASPVITFAKTEQTADYTGNPFAIESPVITMSDGSTPPSILDITYLHKLKTSETWLEGLPTKVGEYDVKAVLKANENFSQSESAPITVKVLGTTPPEGSYTIPTGLKAVTNYQGMLSEVDLPENWTWKTPTENIVISKNKYTAIYTPIDTNYKAIEVDLSIEIVTIDVKYTDSTGKEITELLIKPNEVSNINYTVYGPTDTLSWISSDPSTANGRIDSEGKVLITAGSKAGTNMMGLATNGKLLKGLLVKVTEANNPVYSAENINSIAKDLKGKDPFSNKDIINDVVKAMRELSDSEKAKLTPDAIKDMDVLYCRANGIDVTVSLISEASAKLPIKNISVVGAGIAANGNKTVQIKVVQAKTPIKTPNAAAELELSMITENGTTQLVTPVYVTVEMGNMVLIDRIIHHKSDGTTENINLLRQDATTLSFIIQSFSSLSFMTKTPVVVPPTNNGNGSTIIGGTTGSGSSSSSYYYTGSSSSGSSSKSTTNLEQAQKDFWENVVDMINNAKDGDTIKVNAKYFDKMPISVLKALRGNDITLTIKWNNGDDIIVNGDNLISWETQRLYYPLSKLLALYKDVPVEIKTESAKIEYPVYSEDSKTNKDSETQETDSTAKSASNTATGTNSNGNTDSGSYYSGTGTGTNASKDNPATGTILEISAPAEAEIMPSTNTPINAGFEKEALPTTNYQKWLLVAGILAVMAGITVLILRKRYNENN